jgi:hypothetical protein
LLPRCDLPMHPFWPSPHQLPWIQLATVKRSIHRPRRSADCQRSHGHASIP